MPDLCRQIPKAVLQRDALTSTDLPIWIPFLHKYSFRDMHNMWHNGAAVLEAASDLMKQMIHLQLKSRSLGRRSSVSLAGCLRDGGPAGKDTGPTSPTLSTSLQPPLHHALCEVPLLSPAQKTRTPSELSSGLIQYAGFGASPTNWYP